MANPSFQSLLSKNGVTTKDLTNAIKKLIGEYQVLETALPQLRTELKKKDLSDKQKQDLQQELATVEEQMPLLDTKIATAIKDWLPKRQQIKERTDRMLAGKNKKNAGGALPPAAAPAAPAAPAEPAPPKNDPPPAKPAAQQQSNQPPAQSSSPTDAKKGRSPIVGIGLAILGGIAAGFGISLFFKRD